MLVRGAVVLVELALGKLH
jgi:pre-mRNA-splicing factor ATP-dependent RNA helicase DHX38/PRP16